MDDKIKKNLVNKKWLKICIFSMEIKFSSGNNRLDSWVIDTPKPVKKYKGSTLESIKSDLGLQ